MEEREAIVAWLRGIRYNKGDLKTRIRVAFMFLRYGLVMFEASAIFHAGVIERGEHLEEQKNDTRF